MHKSLKMENKKLGENRRTSIPFIRIDSTAPTTEGNNQILYISSSSSEESLPVDAPLVRQSRCSLDIDAISLMMMGEKSDGNESHSSSYLEIPDQKSIHDST